MEVGGHLLRVWLGFVDLARLSEGVETEEAARFWPLVRLLGEAPISRMIDSWCGKIPNYLSVAADRAVQSLGGLIDQIFRRIVLRSTVNAKVSSPTAPGERGTWKVCSLGSRT